MPPGACVRVVNLFIARMLLGLGGGGQKEKNKGRSSLAQLAFYRYKSPTMFDAPTYRALGSGLRIVWASNRLLDPASSAAAITNASKT